MEYNMEQRLNPRARRNPGELARTLFDRMLAAAGPRHWWPCEPGGPGCGKDEMIIGAVLTQNTAWVNVERALENLRREGLIDLRKLAQMEPEAIARFIRPAGYYNLKARRLSAVASFFAPDGEYRFDELARLDDAALREEVLGVFGVGRETADSILLYALKRPSFVIDAYTLRIGRRHGIFDAATDYEAARAWFTQFATPSVNYDTVDYFNEYHALIVWIGKYFCKPTPRCGECPLAERGCFATSAAWKAIQPYR